MIGKYKFGSCLSTFQNCADRYCLDGYGGGGDTIDQKVEMALQVGDIDGLELVGNWHVNNENIYDVGKKFKQAGIEICMLVPDLWTQAKWGKGSFTSVDANTRKAAIEEVKKVMDWADELGCEYVDVWLGQDGYDYVCQSDYLTAWKRLQECLAGCAGHNKNVRILVEYKPQEPRKYCYVDSAAKTLLLLADLDNVGVMLDLGHSLQGRENISEAAALLSSYGKLDYIHLNDNYGTWDDDLMCASVHLNQFVEFFYWLKKLDYQGWLTLDVFPFREDGVQAGIQCRKWLETIIDAVDKSVMSDFENVISQNNACKSMELIRKTIFGR